MVGYAAPAAGEDGTPGPDRRRRSVDVRTGSPDPDLADAGGPAARRGAGRRARPRFSRPHKAAIQMKDFAINEGKPYNDSREARRPPRGLPVNRHPGADPPGT